MLTPVEAEVDSEVRPLLVDASPVDNEPTLLALVLMPLDAEVESDATPLLVVERPEDADVESDPT